MENSRYKLIVVLTFIILIYVEGKELKCGFPGTPAYGYIKPDNVAYAEGDTVAYSCRVGYILLGSPISRCIEDGSWSKQIPICDDSMTTLGVAFSTATLPGYRAELAIDRDKETCTFLKPNKPRWWRIDLGNEHKVLSVAVTLVSTDKNVKFTVSVIKIQGVQSSYKRCASFTGKFGTQTVVLSCAEGKGIVGQKVHIEDHYQASKPEEIFELCEVEVQVEKDTGYECGRPSRNLYSITSEPENKMVDYGCIKGYEINGREYRVCQNDGQWSGEPPKCDPILCEDLEDIENGQIRLSQGNKSPPLEGAVAIYRCREGFKLIGPFTRNCLKDGTWNTKSPQCKAIRCPIPDGRDVGGVYRLLNQTNSMGSMALLRCKGGKREGDNPYIICSKEGEWTEPEAYCILPARAASEKNENEPIIANQAALIFGMFVAAMMIVIVLVGVYFYGHKRDTNKPELPSRHADLVPPPRPPPRHSKFKSAFMGCIEGAWNDEKYRPIALEPAVTTIDGGDENSRLVFCTDKENTAPSPETRTKSDYAVVDYEKKRQSRAMQEHDFMESDVRENPSLKTDEDENDIKEGEMEEEDKMEEEDENVNEEEGKKKEEEEKREQEEEKRKQEEEKREQEEEKRKQKEEKIKQEEEKRKQEEEKRQQEEEKRKQEEKKKAEKEKVEEEKRIQDKEKKTADKEEQKEAEEEKKPRRRRIRDEPSPAEMKPALRRFRNF